MRCTLWFMFVILCRIHEEIAVEPDTFLYMSFLFVSGMALLLNFLKKQEK